MSKVLVLPEWGARAWLFVAAAVLIVSSAIVWSPERADAQSKPVACGLMNVSMFPVRCVGDPELVKVTHEFAAGYLGAKGPKELLPHIVNNVMFCESSYDRHAFNRVGPFYGLMQFLPSTWHALDGGDWYEPRNQGANTAKLIADSPPGTQWPVCWYAA